VMGTLAFPDATPGVWVMGEATPISRNLASPTVANYAAFIERTASGSGSCDMRRSARPDHRTHVRRRVRPLKLRDRQPRGGPARRRRRLAGAHRDRPRPAGSAILETLTKRMHPWATYLDEVHNTWETARVFAATGKTVLDTTTPAPGDTLPFTGVADQVLWAFTRVCVPNEERAGCR
jgi:hypothetical protein